MAKVLFGQGVADMRGSIGGTVFSRNNNGAYTRNRSSVTNPQTPAQQAARLAFGSISTAWGNITASERTGWVTAAAGARGLYVDSLGQSNHYSGQQLFMQVNAVREVFGLGIASAYPVGFFPDLIDFASVVGSVEVANGTTTLESFGITPTISGSQTAADMAFYASAPVSPGNQRPSSAGQYRLLLANEDEDEDEETVLEAYTTAFGEEAAVGSVIWIMARAAIAETGQFGPPFFSVATVVEAAP